MKTKLRYMTQTAVLLALLITLQAVTKPLGQLVTGSCVNAVLALTVLLIGMQGGLTLAVISPVVAFLLGIAPNVVTVLPIMLANACFVSMLWLFGRGKQPLWRKGVAVAASAGVKFGLLYVLVVKTICGFASGALLGKKLGQTVVLAPPMLEKLPGMFTWPQLITAIIGAVIALSLTPVLEKAIKK